MPVFVYENWRPTSHLPMLDAIWVDWVGDWLDAGFRLRKPASNFPFANAWLPYGYIGWAMPVYVYENRRRTYHLPMLGCHMGRLGGRCQFMSTKTGVQLPICQCIATLWVDWLGDWLDAGFRLRKPVSNFPFANAWLPYG